MNYEAPESVKYHGGYDPADPPQDGVWCSEHECWEDECPGHCDVCGRGLTNQLEFDDGICRFCSIEWLAQRQLTYPTPQSDPRLAALASAALRAEEIFGIDECERYAAQLRKEPNQ